MTSFLQHEFSSRKGVNRGHVEFAKIRGEATLVCPCLAKPTAQLTAHDLPLVQMAQCAASITRTGSLSPFVVSVTIATSHHQRIPLISTSQNSLISIVRIQLALISMVIILAVGCQTDSHRTARR